MASAFQLLTVLVMALFAARNDECRAFSIYNATLERQPKEEIEVYKFTVPHQVVNGERGSGRGRQSVSPHGQTYEVYIKPQEYSGQNVSGDRKITLFVNPNESGNRQLFHNSSMQKSHRNSHDPTPLTVKTVGPIIETFQQKKAEKNNFTNTSDPFNKQANEFHALSNRNNNEQSVKRVQIVPDMAGGRGSVQQQAGEIERRNGNGVSVPFAGRQELYPTQYRQENGGNSGFDQRAPSEFNTYKATTDGNFPRQLFESQESARGVEKQLVYDPDHGIASQLNIADSQEPGRPAQEQTYGGSWTSSRRPPARDDFRDDRTESWVVTAPARIHRDSNNNQQSRRSTPDNRPAAGDYSIIGSGGNNRGRPEEKYPSDGKAKYPYNRDPSSEGTDSRLPFQQVEDQRDRRSTTPSPTPTNAYFGFPESFTKNMQENSRVSSTEIDRPLPQSPCQSIVKYTTHEEDRWYADIHVSTDETLTGMRLDIDLSGSADLMTADTAEVKSSDNTRFTVLSLKKKLVPGLPDTVRIMVKYNQEDPPPPVIRAIRLNGRLICPARINTTPKPPTRQPVFPFDILEEQKVTTSRNPGLYTRPPAVNEYLTTTTRRTASKPYSTSKRTTASNGYVPSPNPDTFQESELLTLGRPTTKRPNIYRPGNDNARPSGIAGGVEQKIIPCGMPAIQPRPLITNGQATTRGQWPWHVGLYKNIGPNLSYACGGSLVTERHVITAAHCVTIEYTSVALDPKVFLIYLGKYHLYVWTENGITSREVSRVSVHPNYNGTSFRADLAVLTLSNKVEYTDFIRPVCLWDARNTRVEDIVGIEGTVVGWGFDEKKQLTEELRQAKMPVVSDNVCLRSFPEFYPKFTSNMTYCAGYKNGTSVCNGDSGGGMFFPIRVNREERWYLRGLVSLSPSEKDSRICDTKHYIIFTDVAKYLSWLADVLF